MIEFILKLLVGEAYEWAKNNLDTIRRWIEEGLSTYEIIRKINNLLS